MLINGLRRVHYNFCVIGGGIVGLAAAREPLRRRPGAQAVTADGTHIHHFLFTDTKRMVHVLNAPSPAATAAMPIARVIVSRALCDPEQGA